MKISLINGSPKASNSASELLAKDLKPTLSSHAECTFLKWNRAQASSADMDTFFAGDAVVFFFPLYVDGIPAHLLRIMQELEAQSRKRSERYPPKIYAVVNCGFFEGVQAHLALDIMKNWCRRAGFKWGMGIGLGAGPMAGHINAPMGKGLKKNYGLAYQELTQSILEGRSYANRYADPNFPRKLYITMAHMGWRSDGKRNGLSKADLYRTDFRELDT